MVFFNTSLKSTCLNDEALLLSQKVLRTTLLTCQIIKISRLSHDGLQEFCCSSSPYIANHLSYQVHYIVLLVHDPSEGSCITNLSHNPSTSQSTIYLYNVLPNLLFTQSRSTVITTDHFCHLYVDHECDNLLVLLPEVSPLLDISMNTNFVLMAPASSEWTVWAVSWKHHMCIKCFQVSKMQVHLPINANSIWRCKK